MHQLLSQVKRTAAKEEISRTVDARRRARDVHRVLELLCGDKLPKDFDREAVTNLFNETQRDPLLTAKLAIVMFESQVRSLQLLRAKWSTIESGAANITESWRIVLLTRRLKLMQWALLNFLPRVTASLGQGICRFYGLGSVQVV